MPIYRIEARTIVYCYRKHCAPSEKQSREWVRDEIRDSTDGLAVSCEEVTDAATVPLAWRESYPWTDVSSVEQRTVGAILEDQGSECGRGYEAGSEEQANEPGRLCRKREVEQLARAYCADCEEPLLAIVDPEEGISVQPCPRCQRQRYELGKEHGHEAGYRDGRAYRPRDEEG